MKRFYVRLQGFAGIRKRKQPKRVYEIVSSLLSEERQHDVA